MAVSPGKATYPDSVSRVKPPKMTMPKTLTALPNSQYATPLSLVLGQLLEFAPLAPAVLSTTAAFTLAGETVALFRNGCVDFHRTADCRTEGWRVETRTGRAWRARSGELTQGRLTNSLRERRGAAVRSCGKAWKMEAMAVMEMVQLR